MRRVQRRGSVGEDNDRSRRTRARCGGWLGGGDAVVTAWGDALTAREPPTARPRPLGGENETYSNLTTL